MTAFESICQGFLGATAGLRVQCEQLSSRYIQICRCDDEGIGVPIVIMS